ncbi:hypothetical protein E3N88_28442 [Mikania micrantha]|uniref:Tf2-1-like SH3-like domain-containing protein n=1 Tax=Mikania micrantha TaxID=192012 RepID=A0A5N6N019_9ASTR|nr:hypothetical protein E3N88_28442 [Mikania micrantha]
MTDTQSAHMNHHDAHPCRANSMYQDDNIRARVDDWDDGLDNEVDHSYQGGWDNDSHEARYGYHENLQYAYANQGYQGQPRAPRRPNVNQYPDKGYMTSFKIMEVPVGEHLRLDKYDSTMVDSQRCWQLSRWKYRWVNILDLINMTPQWWIARGAGNCLDGSTGGWKYRWVNILDLINMTPQWWIARGAGNCLRWKYRGSKIDMHWAISSGTLKCRTPVCWGEVGQRELAHKNVVKATNERINQIRAHLKAAQDRQKSYADKRRRPIEFQVGDFVLLKVSPWKGVIRFRKQGKLGPRFIGPFKIIARVGEVAYRLELPEELSGIHNTFHVSYLRKCLADESAYIPLEDIEIDNRLNYVERSVAIIDRKVKQLRNKTLSQVMVQWKNRTGSEVTWESENEMRKYYLFLFEMEVPVGEHLRLDKYDSTMVDSQSQRCWQLSRWKYRWVNILDLINMTPQWWIARGAGNCLRWKYRG